MAKLLFSGMRGMEGELISKGAGLPKVGGGCHAQGMKRMIWLYTVLGAVLVCGLAAFAQERGIWRAVSNTAMSITGDVVFSPDKITMNFTSYTIARIRDLKTEEVQAVFDPEQTGGSGSLYRLNVPAAKRFLHKNTLCGAEDTEWMATYVAGKSLQIAFFSGMKPPALTIDAINSATNLCGTFSYVR